MDVDKAKTKRKLYVGQELEFRRDHMEVTICIED
jgi:actin-like protein 6A